MKSATRNWADITLDACLLGAEAWMVVGLRVAKIAGGGPAACDEAKLMVSEKIESSVELGTALLTGKLGVSPNSIVGGAVSHYLDGVRANRKRLMPAGRKAKR